MGSPAKSLLAVASIKITPSIFNVQQKRQEIERKETAIIRAFSTTYIIMPSRGKKKRVDEPTQVPPQVPRRTSSRQSKNQGVGNTVPSLSPADDVAVPPTSATLEARITVLEATVADLPTSATLEANITVLKATNADLTDALNAIENSTRFTRIEESINGLEEQIASLREQTASLPEDIASLREDIARLREQIASSTSPNNPGFTMTWFHRDLVSP